MKKLIIPGFLMLFAIGLGQQKANAGGFSFGISIGDNHRHPAPAVVLAPPQIICAPPVVVAQPQVVVAEPVCAPAPGYVVVREYGRGGYWGRGHRGGWQEHYRADYRRGRH
jgi:hypothetical protein